MTEVALRIINADDSDFVETPILERLYEAKEKLKGTQAGMFELLKGSNQTLRKTQECLDALHKV